MPKLDDYPEAYNVVDFPYRVFQYDENNVAFESRRTREIRLAPKRAVGGVFVGRPITVRISTAPSLLMPVLIVIAFLLLCIVTVGLFK